MKHQLRVFLVAATLLLSAAAPSRAELDVPAYIELTIARLELVEASWRDRDEPPSEEELDELYSAHGTDREAYFCFSGEKSREIRAYLEEHPEHRSSIDELAAAIRRKIAQRNER